MSEFPRSKTLAFVVQTFYVLDALPRSIKSTVRTIFTTR